MRSALLAHQGGWDEFGIPLLVVFLFFFGALRRRKRIGPASDAAGSSKGCAYCVAPLRPDAERCERCGFKTTPAGDA